MNRGYFNNELPVVKIKGIHFFYKRGRWINDLWTCE